MGWLHQRCLGVFSDWYVSPCAHATVAFGFLRWNASEQRNEKW